MSATKPSRPSFSIVTVAAFLASAALAECRAAELHVGGATVSITPDRPVALAGQMHTRIARDVESPVTATALALESREGDKVLDRAILVSCDLVAIDAGVLEQVRRRVKDRLPDFDVRKLVLNATHTHTAPVMKEGDYEIPKDGVMQPAEYAEFLSSRVAEAAVKAWESRKPGRVGWGLGHAVVAQNRRSVYADGRAQMYGPTDRPDFRGIEGSEDQGVEVLFFWDREGKLLATAINVACPSQEVEGRSAVNADFWHEVRESLRARHGKDLLVLGWTGAAGDQSPHLMYRKRAEERMRTLRGLTRLEELSRRIVAAWDEAYEGARKEQHADVRPGPQGRDDRAARPGRHGGRGRRGPVEGRDALQGASQPHAWWSGTRRSWTATSGRRPAASSPSPWNSTSSGSATSRSPPMPSSSSPSSGSR